MVTFDCTASRHDGVTLVTGQLRELDAPTRVRVENRLDGPVWPPRREGLPEAGWTDTGFAGVVGPGTHALGYATPAPPAERAAVLVDAAPAPDEPALGELTADAESVVRELGDPAPPADAIPTAGDGSDDRQADAGSAQLVRETPVDGVDDGTDALPGDSSTELEGHRSPPEPTRSEAGRLPPEVEPWLAEMERRVDRAAALEAAETVSEATAAVRAAGGMDGVRDIADANDAARLRRLARRAHRLADRRDAATVPVETLATLA